MWKIVGKEKYRAIDESHQEYYEAIFNFLDEDAERKVADES